MITIDWIDDHNPQSKRPQAFRQAPGASFSGLGELRQLFSIAQNRHKSLLDIAGRKLRKAQQVDNSETSKLSNMEEDRLSAMPRSRSMANL